MPVVIGEYGSAAAGGAPVPGGGGGGVELGSPDVARVIGITGTWSEGVTPSSITVEIAGEFVDAHPDFIKPGTRKVMVGGDGSSWVEFNQLWVMSSDNSEETRARGITRITLADQRAFWNARHPFGPRSYNCDVFGESPVPFAATSTGVGGDNKRYGAVFARTAKQILEEIFDELGVPRKSLALAASTSTASLTGFLDIDWGSTTGQELLYAGDQIRGSIGDDMPLFIAPPLMTAGEALQKWLDLYQLSVGLSPDDDRVGLEPRGDQPGTLQALVDAVNALPSPTGRPRRNISDGTERDPTPDILFIQGARILIQNQFPLEPVLKDPDRPHTYLALNKIETLKAYGVPVPSWLDDGEECIRYAMYLTVCESPWSIVPDRLKPDALLAFRLWRECQAQEMVFDEQRPTQEPVPIEEVRTITVETGGFREENLLRYVAPAYRLLRDNSMAGVTLSRSLNGSRYIMDVSAETREAQPWRVTPALPYTLQRRGGAPPGALAGTGGHKSEDYSTGKPRLFVINGLMKYVSSQTPGAKSEDWFDLNFVEGYAAPQLGASYSDPNVWPNWFDAKELGIEPRLIDAQQLVWDTGVAILGSDGQRGKNATIKVKTTIELPPAGEQTGGGSTTVSGGPGIGRRVPKPGRPKIVPLSGGGGSGAPRTITVYTSKPSDKKRSKIVELLDGSTPAGKGQTLAMLYDSLEIQFDAFQDKQDLCPIGTPFLWVQRSFAKASHNDLRDWTAGFSQPPATAGPEPMIDARATNAAFANIGRFFAGPDQRQHQPIVHTHTMPDLQLRCEAVPIEAKWAFKRDGGWNSKRITGTHYYSDVEFRERTSGLAFGNGEYTPVSTSHYMTVLGTMKRYVSAMADKIDTFRKIKDAERVVNADIMGWHRRFFPGVAEYLDAPTGQVALMVSGPSSEASMRIAANSRSWRPYVGSRVSRDFVQLAQVRANTGANNAQFGGD